MVAMKKQPGEEILEKLFYREDQQSEQLKPLLSLYIRDTVQKSESRDYTRLKKWLSDTWKKIVRSVSLLVKDNLKKARLLALLQPRANPRGKRTRNSGHSAHWTTKVNALKETSVARNTIQRMSENPEDKERVPDRPALHDGKEFFGKGKPANMVRL